MQRKRNYFLWVLLACIVSAFLFAGCEKKGGEVRYTVANSESASGELRVEIRVDETEEEYTLLQIMERAKQNGDLSYEASAGMITSINGKANAADFSACWMLYTSDEEMSNAEYGTIVCGNESLGSAIVGANALTVVKGVLYVWQYTSF